MYRRYSFRRRQTIVGSKPTHDNLQQAILQILNTMPNTFAWGMETVGKATRKQDGTWGFRKSLWGRGKPDIGGVKDGKGFVIEVKFGKDTLSPEQEDWLLDYVDRGKGKSVVCRSVDDAVEFWETV